MQLELQPRTWGGKRRGAGRKPSGRKVGVPHRVRPAHNGRNPVHVTLRASQGLPSLRAEPLFPAVRCGLAKASRGGTGSEDRTLLHVVPDVDRLALEMAANEDAERRALRGELEQLEEAWREAEEIAAIADHLLDDAVGG